MRTLGWVVLAAFVVGCLAWMFWILVDVTLWRAEVLRRRRGE